MSDETKAIPTTPATMVAGAVEVLANFKPGYRTAAGWVCVFGLAHVFFLTDWANWAMQTYSLSVGRTVPELKRPDSSYTFELITLFCVLAGIKTYDRVKGVATQ